MGNKRSPLNYSGFDEDGLGEHNADELADETETFLRKAHETATFQMNNTGYGRGSLGASALPALESAREPLSGRRETKPKAGARRPKQAKTAAQGTPQ